MRSAARVERRHRAVQPGGVAGALYVTDRRLILPGPPRVEIRLAAIQEAMVAGQRLLILGEGSNGITIEVDDPEELRAQLGSARAAGWAARCSTVQANPDPDDG
jgi:hypothetical protein